jgi:hemerythrin-like domain-containing protein
LSDDQPGRPPIIFEADDRFVVDFETADQSNGGYLDFHGLLPPCNCFSNWSNELAFREALEHNAAVTTMKITEALLAEHVVFHNLFDYVERTLPKIKTLAEVRALSSLLETMLRNHSNVEDHLLIDPLEAAFAQMGQADNFHDEHAEIEDGLDRIKGLRRVAAAKTCLLQAVVLCRKHFDKEERIVFPMAERQLSPKSLLALGRRWEEQRTVPVL